MNKLWFSIILFSTLSAQSQSLRQVKVGTEEKISFKIPDNFIRMTDQERMSKVYSSKVPLAMFASESQEVTFGVNYNRMQWTPKDTELIYGLYKASINNLFDRTTFMQDEIREINGREFIIFEFVGEVTDDNAFSSRSAQKNYSYIAYTSWKNQVLLFNFSCKEKWMNQWEPIAQGIISSIKIKK